MFARPSENSPWPAQTPLPSSPSSSTSKRKRSSVGHARAAKAPRQTIADQAAIDQAKTTCEDSNNSVFSCWPIESTIVAQDESTQFVWNSNLPEFTQLNLVDVFMARADTGQQLLHFSNLSNPFGRAGSVPMQANDTWWGDSGANWPGHNVSFPFYFVVVASDKTFSDGTPQATFTAVQTTFADSVIASSTSAAAASSSAAASRSSAAALSSSAASASSVSPSSASGVTNSSSLGTGTSTSGRSNSTNGLQGNANGSSFPHWAIAVIVVLGFFAIIAFVVLVFLIVRTVRRRREASPSRRGSMGSQSPMMANAETGAIGSPPLATSNLAPAGAIAASSGRAGSIADGASTHSDGPFSGADAAVMAEAFRKALRKPDFADRPVEEGESPEAAPDTREEELMNRELAEEGRDIRSVGSSRGVKFETLSDSENTAQDSQH